MDAWPSYKPTYVSPRDSSLRSVSRHWAYESTKVYKLSRKKGCSGRREVAVPLYEASLMFPSGGPCLSSYANDVLTLLNRCRSQVQTINYTDF